MIVTFYDKTAIPSFRHGSICDRIIIGRLLIDTQSQQGCLHALNISFFNEMEMEKCVLFVLSVPYLVHVYGGWSSPGFTNQRSQP